MKFFPTSLVLPLSDILLYFDNLSTKVNPFLSESPHLHHWHLEFMHVVKLIKYFDNQT
jgi:hypothetical protein